MSTGELKIRLVQMHYDLKDLETRLASDQASFTRPLSPGSMARMEKNNPGIYKRLIRCLDLREKEKTMKDDWLARTGHEWRMSR